MGFLDFFRNLFFGTSHDKLELEYLRKQAEDRRREQEVKRTQINDWQRIKLEEAEAEMTRRRNGRIKKALRKRLIDPFRERSLHPLGKKPIIRPKPRP